MQLRIPPPGPAWELRLLFDLVCFGLLIKHVLCCVGGASRSGAERFTHPLYSFLSHRCAAAPRRGTAGGGRRRGGPGPAPPHRRKEPSIPPRAVPMLHPGRARLFTVLHVRSHSPPHPALPVSSLRFRPEGSGISRGGRRLSDSSKESCDSSPG